ncbi:MAG: radical SAM protein [Candidatus Muiribacteriaceae bacterium]
MKKVIQLDTTTHCNLNCNFCYKSLEKNPTEKERNLTEQEVAHIIDRAGNISGIALVNNGEFFLNPQWQTILETVFSKASSASADNITLNTNATLLDKNISDIIIKKVKEYKVPFRITFSLNTTDPEYYRALTGKDLLKTAEANTEYFLEKCFARKNTLITCSVQTLINKIETENTSSFIKRWSSYFYDNSITFSICEDTQHTEENYRITLRRIFTGKRTDSDIFLTVTDQLKERFDIRINDSIETGEDYFRRLPCLYLFEDPAMSEEWVTICCRDTEFRYRYKHPGEGLVPEERAMRRAHMEGRFENIELCRNCFNYETLPESRVEEYFNDEALVGMYRHRLETGLAFEFYNIIFETSWSVDIIRGFLAENNLYALYSEKKTGSNIYYTGTKKLSGNQELDFCVMWLRNLRVSGKKIFTGCHRCRININDFNAFRDSLNNRDYTCLPDQCYYCRDKFSHDPLRDRYMTYGGTGKNSPCIPDQINSGLYADLLEYMKNKNTASALECVRKLDNFSYYESMFALSIRYRLDDQNIYQAILESENIFLMHEYALYTENFFEPILIESFNWSHRHFPEKVNTKLIGRHLEKGLKYDILQLYVENLLSMYRNNENIYNSADDILLKNSIEHQIIKKIKNIRDEFTLVDIYKNWQKYLQLPEIRKAFSYQLLIISRVWDVETFLNILKKLEFEFDPIVNDTLHFRIMRKYKTEGLPSLMELVVKYGLFTMKDIPGTIHTGLMEIARNRDYFAFFFELVDKYSLKEIDGVKGVISNNLMTRLKTREYRSILYFIKKYKDYFLNDGKDDIEHILRLSFQDYSPRFIRFLYALSFVTEHDRCMYLIYSWYMKKEKYDKALYFLDLIDNKQSFIKNTDATYIFLYRKNRKIFRFLTKAIKFRLGLITKDDR